VLVLQEFQVSNLVAPESVDDIVLCEQLGNLRGGLLVLLQLGQHLLPLAVIFCGWVVNAVQLAVHRGDVVGHVGVLQEVDLSSENLLGESIIFLLLGLVALELNQRE